MAVIQPNQNFRSYMKLIGSGFIRRNRLPRPQGRDGLVKYAFTSLKFDNILCNSKNISVKILIYRQVKEQNSNSCVKQKQKQTFNDESRGNLPVTDSEN